MVVAGGKAIGAARRRLTVPLETVADNLDHPSEAFVAHMLEAEFDGVDAERGGDITHEAFDGKQVLSIRDTPPPADGKSGGVALEIIHAVVGNLVRQLLEAEDFLSLRL